MKHKKLLCLMMLLVFALSFAVPSSAADASTCATVKYGSEEKNYTSFKDAWNSAVDAAGSQKDVVFTLYKNWQADSNGSFGSGAGFKDGAIYYNKQNNITIDLNGCTIDRSIYTPIDGGAVIYVASKMTVIDSKPDEYSSAGIVKGGVITGGANNERGGGIVISDGAALIFNGGTILNCVSTDDGGSFYGNRTYDASGECCGGAVYADEASINIKNAVFEGNYAENDGGAIYAVDGDLSVEGTEFYSNSSRKEGGAVYLTGEQKTSFEKCVFEKNKSADNGGAIYIDSNTGTYLTNCRMYYNTSENNGGTLFVNGEKTFINNGEYRFNSASAYGGGIYVDSAYDINVSGKLIITDNTVKDQSSNLCLQNGTFSTAYLFCGGLYDGSSVSIGSTDSSSRLAISGIDKYQYNNYIRFDDGFTVDRIEQHQTSDEGIRAEGSALGSGNFIIVAVLTGIIIVAVIGITVYSKKKRKGAAVNDK